MARDQTFIRQLSYYLTSNKVVLLKIAKSLPKLIKFLVRVWKCSFEVLILLVFAICVQ